MVRKARRSGLPEISTASAILVGARLAREGVRERTA
jgi:hypothetical protein